MKHAIILGESDSYSGLITANEVVITFLDNAKNCIQYKLSTHASCNPDMLNTSLQGNALKISLKFKSTVNPR
jgi:hypothetical protein